MLFPQEASQQALKKSPEIQSVHHTAQHARILGSPVVKSHLVYIYNVAPWCITQQFTGLLSKLQIAAFRVPHTQ